jgi:hypothetical protein
MTDELAQAAPVAGRTMTIKGLAPSLPERGKIKIGMKGAATKSGGGKSFQPPKKLDHFLVTTTDRAADGNFARDEAIHAKLGAKPTEIPVRLIYDDPALNFPTRYAAYNGRTLWCAGDGEEARRIKEDGKGHEMVTCPCPRQAPGYVGPDKCKINGALSVLIDGAPGVGGVWKFRTTSYNSVVGILSTLTFIRGITGGPIAGILFWLMVKPKQVADPSGAPQTIYVVSLEYRGNVDDLQVKGHEIALKRATTRISIQMIEGEARRLLAAAPDDAPLPGDDAEDITDEFYHEQANGSDGATVTITQAGDADGERPKSKLDALNDITAEDEQPPTNDAPPPEPPVDEMPADDDGFPGDAPSAVVPLTKKADGKPDYKAWLEKVAALARIAPDTKTLDLLGNANGDILSDIGRLGESGRKNHKWLTDVFDARRDEITGQGEPN